MIHSVGGLGNSINCSYNQTKREAVWERQLVYQCRDVNTQVAQLHLAQTKLVEKLTWWTLDKRVTAGL